MSAFRTVAVVLVLLALIVSVTTEDSKRRNVRHNDGRQSSRQAMPCTNNPRANPYYPPCETTNTAQESTPEPPTFLERAHWCRFGNGSYLPLNQSYMGGRCTQCQCTQSRAIRCQPLECMPTYCADDSMPKREKDQCCTQCASDKPAKSCEYDGLIYPHGTMMKMVEGQMQCWCQLGDIECRQYMGSLFDRLNIWKDGKTVFCLGIILCLVPLFGLLVCCSLTFSIYFYYQKNHVAIQQAYNEYFSTGGWQPVEEEPEEEEEEQGFVEYGEKEKQLEAESYEPIGTPGVFLPPPYAIVSNSYVQTEEQK